MWDLLAISLEVVCGFCFWGFFWSVLSFLFCFVFFYFLIPCRSADFLEEKVRQ